MHTTWSNRDEHTFTLLGIYSDEHTLLGIYRDEHMHTHTTCPKKLLVPVTHQSMVLLKTIAFFVYTKVNITIRTLDPRLMSQLRP